MSLIILGFVLALIFHHWRKRLGPRGGLIPPSSYHQATVPLPQPKELQNPLADSILS